MNMGRPVDESIIYPAAPGGREFRLTGVESELWRNSLAQRSAAIRATTLSGNVAPLASSQAFCHPNSS